MYTITTELGTFSGKTEREAKKELRRAQRAEQERQARQGQERDLAYVRAKAGAYGLLVKLANGGAVSECASMVRIGESYAPWRVTMGAVPEVLWFGKNGEARSKHPGCVLLAGVVDNAGFPIALFYHEDNKPGRIECAALGIEGECVAFVDVPGVTMGMFEEKQR